MRGCFSPLPFRLCSQAHLVCQLLVTRCGLWMVHRRKNFTCTSSQGGSTQFAGCMLDLVQTKIACFHVTRDKRSMPMSLCSTTQLRMRCMQTKHHDLTASQRPEVKLPLRHSKGLARTVLLQTRWLRARDTLPFRVWARAVPLAQAKPPLLHQHCPTLLGLRANLGPNTPLGSCLHGRGGLLLRRGRGRCGSTSTVPRRRGAIRAAAVAATVVHRATIIGAVWACDAAPVKASRRASPALQGGASYHAQLQLTLQSLDITSHGDVQQK